MLVFNKKIHHILLQKTLVIFNEVNDEFMIFDETDTREIIFNLSDSPKPPLIIENLKRHGILVRASSRQYISTIQMDGYGIGSYSWDRREHFTRGLDPYSVSKATMAGMWTKWKLVAFGLPNMLDYMRKLKYKSTKENNNRRSSDKIDPISISSALISASRFFPFRFECLEFSCTLFNILASNGFRPNFNIGVQNYNFLSHAWVDLDGAVIGDRTDMFQRISPIIRI